MRALRTKSRCASIPKAKAIGLALVLAAAPALGHGAQSSVSLPPAPSPTASPSPIPTPTPEPPKLQVSISGFFESNGYSQNNFFFGRGASGAVGDKDAYSVQVFRIQPEFAYGPDLKAVIRIDLAQGIWGIDDQLRDNDRPGFSSLFNNKDTNFTVHLDWAYVEFTPAVLAHWTFRVGRMKNQLGNLLIVDQDGDGIQIQKQLGKWRLLTSWAKMSEGPDALTDGVFPGLDGRDADLFYVDLLRKNATGEINPFVAFYKDRNRLASYVPQGLQYFRARFIPNLSKAWVFGAAGSLKRGRLALKGEASVLTGKDEIANANSGPFQLLDVNNGDLSGYNLYVDARLGVGKQGTLGAVFGQGSGDEDPTSGKGNINKIRTNGFFYINEVWEDSIMPDEEGITGQGLGAASSRGYREFENNRLLQLNYSHQVSPRLRLFGSATLVRALHALHPWSDVDKNNAIDPAEFGVASSKHLGEELDGLVDWTLMPNLLLTLRGGVFFPGDAAGYLVNGTNAYSKRAWELRAQLRLNFAGKW